MEQLTQEINDLIDKLERHKIYLKNSEWNDEMEHFNRVKIQKIKCETIDKVRDLLQLLEK